MGFFCKKANINKIVSFKVEANMDIGMYNSQKSPSCHPMSPCNRYSRSIQRVMVIVSNI